MSKRKIIEANANGFVVTPDPIEVEAKDIKERQRKRKIDGRPAKVTNEMIYEMLSDVLENQARIENMLTEKQL